MIDAARYNDTFEKYEEIVEGMRQVHAFNDISSTLNFEQFNAAMLNDYFNIVANLSLQVKESACKLEPKILALKEK